MTKLIQSKNRLKEKVGNGVFNKDDIEKAQKSIEENKVDFRPIARDFLEDLGVLISSTKAGKRKVEGILGEVLDPLMQLRAQGSLFHYPSITQLSDVIVDFLDTVESMNDDIMQIVIAYKKAADAILTLEIKDDKDKTCVDFINELQAACSRYKQKNNI